LQRAYESGQDTSREAFAAYSRAIRLSPRDPDRWIDRGLLAVAMHDLNTAQADLEQAGKLLPDYSRYDGAMAVFALARNDLSAAAMWQERAQQAQQAWDDWSWRR
jgi:Flp pilus assembly protein TadD